MNYHIKWILNTWRNHKTYILLLLFMTTLSTFVAVVYPYMFKKLLDTLEVLIKENDITKTKIEINKILLIFFSVGIAKFLAGFYPTLRAYMNLKFEHLLRTKYFSHILEKNYKFFNKFFTGDLVTRLTDDLSDYPKICWFLCSGIFRAFDSLMQIIFCLAVMLSLNIKLTILAIFPIPLMILIFYFTSEKLYKSFKNNQEAISEINNQLEMSFSGVRIIKSFVCENKYKRFFLEALNKRFTTEMNLVKLGTIINLIYEYIDKFTQIGVIIFGGVMVVQGKITIGTFFAFYSYLSLLIYPILDLPQLFVSGKQAFVNIDRLEEIKNFPIIKNNNSVKHKIDKIEEIEFRNVYFYYDEEQKHVLNNINIKIKKGEKIVILGPVGSGKSTILGLLTGILTPVSGEMFINGYNFKEIDLYDFREKIGFVPQEPLLFSGTIKENILFGKDDVSSIDFYKKIINVVQMENEISQFSDKDNTLIGQRGVSLSGGQKQRVAIARALMRKPQVLILDDITASLDAENEEKLWNEIKTLFNDITCFIVSNRLSTIRYMDNVIFIDSGIIIGKGKHNELLNISNTYKTFIEQHYKKSG